MAMSPRVLPLPVHRCGLCPYWRGTAGKMGAAGFWIEGPFTEEGATARRNRREMERGHLSSVTSVG